MMIWERSGGAYYAIAETPSGEHRFYLTVEQLSDRAWDWSVCRPRVSPHLAVHGLADTVHAAMQAAEAVVR
jgi:hypothetical protein